MGRKTTNMNVFAHSTSSAMQEVDQKDAEEERGSLFGDRSSYRDQVTSTCNFTALPMCHKETRSMAAAHNELGQVPTAFVHQKVFYAQSIVLMCSATGPTRRSPVEHQGLTMVCMACP